MRQDALALGLDAGELGADLFRVGKAGRNLLATRLEHLEDRLVGERVQHGADNAEADRLGAEVRPVDAKRPGDFGERPAAALRDFLRDHGCYCTRNNA